MRFSLSLLFIYLFFVFACLRLSSKKPPTLPQRREKPVSNWHLFMEFATAREKFLLAWKKAHWICGSSIILKPLALKQKQWRLLFWIPFYWVPTYPSLLTFLNSKSSPSQDTIFINQTVIFGFQLGPFHGWILRPWKTYLHESCGYSCNAWTPHWQSDKLEEADVMNFASPALTASTNVTRKKNKIKTRWARPIPALMAIN